MEGNKHKVNKLKQKSETEDISFNIIDNKTKQVKDISEENILALTSDTPDILSDIYDKESTFEKIGVS